MRSVEALLVNTFEGGTSQLPQDEQGLPIDEDITGVVPPRCSTVQLYHGGTVEDITGVVLPPTSYCHCPTYHNQTPVCTALWEKSAPPCLTLLCSVPWDQAWCVTLCPVP